MQLYKTANNVNCIHPNVNNIVEKNLTWEIFFKMLICRNLCITDVIHVLAIVLMACAPLLFPIFCSSFFSYLFDISPSQSVWIIVQHLFWNSWSWCVFVLTEFHFRKTNFWWMESRVHTVGRWQYCCLWESCVFSSLKLVPLKVSF